MSKNKTPPSPENNEAAIVRSSAAEYLTFVAAAGQGGVEAVFADENVWLTQKMMGQLYDVETHTINYHLKKVFDDSELEAASVIRNFRITAADGKSYNTRHYNLKAIIAVGYKVNSERAVQQVARMKQSGIREQAWSVTGRKIRDCTSFHPGLRPISRQPISAQVCFRRF